MRVSLVALLGAAVAASVSASRARADPHQWIDDEVEQVVEAPLAGGQVQVERRSMIYGSGYLYVALTATYRPARGVARRTLLAEGPTMCSDARLAGGKLVVETCVERFGDTREVVVWRLDRATGRFVAGVPRHRSPYAERAQAIVADLRAGRDARARVALEALGDSPDGHGTIAWWWSAQRLLADWPAITHARPAEARRRVAAHVRRLLEPDDLGEPSLRAAVAAADLAVVPRTGYDDGSGARRGFRVGGPRRLGPVVTRAIAMLRAGGAAERALADAASAALP